MCYSNIPEKGEAWFTFAEDALSVGSHLGSSWPGDRRFRLGLGHRWPRGLLRAQRVLQAHQRVPGGSPEGLSVTLAPSEAKKHQEKRARQLPSEKNMKLNYDL